LSAVSSGEIDRLSTALASPPGIADLLDLSGFLEQTRRYKTSTDEVNRFSSEGETKHE
jgi:hypothetical protein